MGEIRMASIDREMQATDLSPEEFETYISDPRFNQIFQLPADPSRVFPDPLQISYSDFGYHCEHTSDENDDDEENVLLFFGPLLSSRLFSTTKDELARRYKIRMISAERPGIGKTDNVPIDKRLEIWREIIVALLNHLKIKHVSITCHSAGTLFGLDFALHYPQFLHPSRPYIAIAGPWVHPIHSGMRLWSVASGLPSSLVGNVNKMVSFANAYLFPAFGVSAAISGSVSQLWTRPKVVGREGPDVIFEERMMDRLARVACRSNVSGLGQEARILLRNGVAQDGWSDWGDLDVLAPRLAHAVKDVGGVRLKLDMFFAEKDNMIGDAGSKGVQWLESCWVNIHDVDFTSEVIKGSDHDTVWGLRWDVIERVFKTISQEK